MADRELRSEKPVILAGRKVIAAHFEVSESVVRAWWRGGAPIRVTGEGNGRRYYCELGALRKWLRNGVT